MEYERIHKVQTGMISPSKLRMKLMGAHHQMKKKEGSNSNSARTSPSKLDDSEFVNNSLLASTTSDFDDQVSSMEVSSVKLSGNAVSDASEVDQGSCQTREHGNANRVKIQQFSKTDSVYSNSSSVHPVRTLDDENLDYDSNASSSSFEFHKGERSVHNPISKSLLRPMSSKWNDAEKWIINKHNIHGNHSKKNTLQSQGNRIVTMSAVRVAPESASSVKRVDFCLPAASQVGLDKFSFDPPMPQPVAGQASRVNVAIDMSTESSDLKEMDNIDISRGKSSTEDTTDVPAIRSVSMRDMGTEMTPIPSQEPSRTSTPLGATTPLRSPTSSIPSTPRGGPTSTPVEQSFGSEARRQTENGRNELSEQELKLKTRKEILALGVQLGKTNIAAWASNEEKEKKASAVEAAAQEEVLRIEFEKRAAAWEDAENSKHNARFKREEIKIHAWESQQKAKLEAELRKIEAQVEQMRAHARAKMVKKIAMARQRSEERRAAAEAMKNSQAEKTAAQAEYIRQTGRIPSSPYLCCGWS